MTCCLRGIVYPPFPPLPLSRDITPLYVLAMVVCSFDVLEWLLFSLGAVVFEVLDDPFSILKVSDYVSVN